MDRNAADLPPAYSIARPRAIARDRPPGRTFPPTCPFSLDEMLLRAYLPEQ